MTAPPTAIPMAAMALARAVTVPETELAAMAPVVTGLAVTGLAVMATVATGLVATAATMVVTVAMVATTAVTMVAITVARPRAAAWLLQRLVSVAAMVSRSARRLATAAASPRSMQVSVAATASRLAQR